MPLWLTIILIILAVVAAILVVLYFVGTKLQKKQAEQQSMMEAMAQTVSMLVIDKKRMKLKDAGFPPMVYEPVSYTHLDVYKRQVYTLS